MLPWTKPERGASGRFFHILAAALFHKHKSATVWHTLSF